MKRMFCTEVAVRNVGTIIGSTHILVDGAGEALVPDELVERVLAIPSWSLLDLPEVPPKVTPKVTKEVTQEVPPEKEEPKKQKASRVAKE